MVTKDIILNYLKQYKQKHLDDYGIKNIGIFGSIAREENTKNSDIDIVVEFSKPNLFVQAVIHPKSQDNF